MTRHLSAALGILPLGTLRLPKQILPLLINACSSPADSLHVYRAYYGYLHRASASCSRASHPDCPIRTVNTSLPGRLT